MLLLVLWQDILATIHLTPTENDWFRTFNPGIELHPIDPNQGSCPRPRPVVKKVGREFRDYRLHLKIIGFLPQLHIIKTALTRLETFTQRPADKIKCARQQDHENACAHKSVM